MTNIQDIRAKFPQYSDLSDEDLAGALHSKYYADIPREQFDAQIGLKPKGFMGRAVDFAADTARGIGQAIVGKQDPANAGLPTYAPASPDLIAGRERAKTVTFDDQAYADILAKQLGPRFLGMEKDANGYPILKYTGDDGQPQRAYVNQPGLDWQDVDRGVMGALPYLATAGPIAKATKALGTLPRMAMQAVGGAGTSIGQDVVAGQMGSEQGIDLPRAGFAALGGAVAEGAAPALTAMGRWYRGGARYLDDAGNLTDDAARIARDAGIDPATLDDEMAKAFAEGLNIGRDPAEIASWIKTNRFGIPTTKAQRTKDPQLSIIEKDIRSGNLGQQSKSALDQFYKDQERQIRGSALNRSSRKPGEPVNPYDDGVGAMIAPTRNDFGPEGLTPGSLGRGIQETLKSAKDKGDEAIEKAWTSVKVLEADPQAFQTLPTMLRNKLGPIRPDDALTPTAVRMVKDIQSFTKGEGVPGEAAEFLGQKPVRYLDEQRRRLLAMYQGAQNNTDRAAAKAVYEGFNDWIDDVADKGLVRGDPASAANLRTAREVTREVKGLFDPRGKNMDPAAARILKNITDKDGNADNIVGEIFGGGGPQTAPKSGSVQALQQIKKILNDPNVGGGEEAARTWNDIRMAYWSRLVIDKSGKMASPQVASENLKKALRNQGVVMQTLFDPAERKVIREYSEALAEAAFRDPNPSGTATGLRALMKNDGSWIKTLLQTQSKRELFSKHNVFMSRFYQVLAKRVPVDILGSKDAAAMAAARQITSQSLTKKPAAATGPLGAAIGAQMGSDE